VDHSADLYRYDSQALITVFDPSAEGLGTVEVTVTSPTDPEGKTLISLQRLRPDYLITLILPLVVALFIL